MHWEFLIPVIAIGVYILSSLLRGNEEDAPPPRQRPGGARPQARPSTDIDRFLEEADRRRRQAEQQRNQPQQRQGRPTQRPRSAPPPPPQPVQPVKRPAPARVAPPPPPSRVETGTSVRVPAVPVTVRPAIAQPVVEAVLSEVIVEEPIAAVRPAQLQRLGRHKDDQPNPVIKQVMDMLQSPRSAQAAIVLHQILSPPRSKRRGRMY